MAKETKFSIEARNLLKRGVDQLSDAIKVILGPKGRNMIIFRSHDAPYITKGGMTAAKEVELENELKNMGAQLVREVASRTNRDADDNTTTTTVPAQGIIDVGLKDITSGANPMEAKRGISKAVKAVVGSTRKRAKEVGDDLKQIAHVATILANGDEEIGQLIAQAMGEVKKEGIITVEETKGIDTTVDIIEGMQFDNSYVSSYFATDTEEIECRMEKPYILFYEKKLSTIKGLLPLPEKVLQQGHFLLIIAEDIENEALTTPALNRLRAGLKICDVKAPGFGDRHKEILRDMTILTGGTIISEDTDLALEDATIDMLGSAETVTVVKSKAAIVNGDGDKETIADHASQVRHQIENTKSDYDHEKLQERLTKLSDKVAILYVGAGGGIEVKEKRDRVEDTLSAIRAAVEEGTAPGGGTAYIRAISSVEKLKGDADGERTGIEIVEHAIEEPLRQIITSAAKEGTVVVQRVHDGRSTFGCSARTDGSEDLMKHGVIDPAKVTRVALESAASITGMSLTTECVIADIREDKPDPAAMTGADDIGGMI